MAYQQNTYAFFTYLRENKSVRDQIKAAPGKTLLYAGSFNGPIWKELERLKRTDPAYANKETLADVLGQLPSHIPAHSNLFASVNAVVAGVPPDPDGFHIWRALSGIFAANASGQVSFSLGRDVAKVVNASGHGVAKGSSVFAATEIHVLARNRNLDPVTKEIVEYMLRSIRAGKADLNFGYIAG